MAELVQELTGCTFIEAEETLKKFHGNVVDAVESLLVKPVVRGDAYIPPKPVINDGLTPEQREMCRRGRDLQDKVNVVVSVAHSQIRHESQQEEPAASVEPLDQGLLKSTQSDGQEAGMSLQTPQ